MSIILVLLREWTAWYRVLRCRKGFSVLDSVRCGRWLARG
jgi:hypothetical protein